MHTRPLLWLYLGITLLTTTFAAFHSFAHSNDINQATLALDNGERYQLEVTVDIIHLLKQHLAIFGNDSDVIEALARLSLLEQKQLLEQVQAKLSQQSSIYFDDIEHHIAPLAGLHLQQLKRLLAQQANLLDSNASLQTSGNIPAGVSQVAVRFSPLFGDLVLKVTRPQREVIPSASLSDNYPINFKNANQASNTESFSSAIKVTSDYLYQGFVHILPKGLDHILFVLALFLFAKRRSTLIWQVSVFTLAHTITLALGIYGIISLPSDIVEPLIALSIVYVGLENIYRGKQNGTSQTRLPVIFAFGLLHGLGFASVLTEVGLPPSQYALSLIAFNLGVELGQLSVIALAFLCLWPLKNKHEYKTKLVLALNIAIAVIATYWLIERTL